MPVAVPHPDKIRILGSAAAPVKARDTFGRVLGCFDRRSIMPGMAFPVTVSVREGAPIAMENRKRIDPTGPVNDPSALVFVAWITFLDENRRL